jgi:hypothetical protein
MNRKETYTKTTLLTAFCSIADMSVTFPEYNRVLIMWREGVSFLLLMIHIYNNNGLKTGGRTGFSSMTAFLLCCRNRGLPQDSPDGNKQGRKTLFRHPAVIPVSTGLAADGTGRLTGRR